MAEAAGSSRLAAALAPHRQAACGQTPQAAGPPATTGRGGRGPAAAAAEGVAGARTPAAAAGLGPAAGGPPATLHRQSLRTNPGGKAGGGPDTGRRPRRRFHAGHDLVRRGRGRGHDFVRRGRGLSHDLGRSGRGPMLGTLALFMAAAGAATWRPRRRPHAGSHTAALMAAAGRRRPNRGSSVAAPAGGLASASWRQAWKCGDGLMTAASRRWLLIGSCGQQARDGGHMAVATWRWPRGSRSGDRLVTGAAWPLPRGGGHMAVASWWRPEGSGPGDGLMAAATWFPWRRPCCDGHGSGRAVIALARISWQRPTATVALTTATAIASWWRQPQRQPRGIRRDGSVAGAQCRMLHGGGRDDRLGARATWRWPGRGLVAAVRRQSCGNTLMAVATRRWPHDGGFMMAAPGRS